MNQNAETQDNLIKLLKKGKFNDFFCITSRPIGKLSQLIIRYYLEMLPKFLDRPHPSSSL